MRKSSDWKRARSSSAMPARKPVKNQRDDFACAARRRTIAAVVQGAPDKQPYRALVRGAGELGQDPFRPGVRARYREAAGDVDQRRAEATSARAVSLRGLRCAGMGVADRLSIYR